MKNPLLHYSGLLLAVLLPLSALADPPARIGRLAAVENDVVFRVDRDDPGAPATINWPISSGAVLDTGADGRAEVQVGANAFRMAGNSRVIFAAIDDSREHLQVTEGSLAVSLLDGDQAAGVIVETPEGRMRFVSAGRFRVDVMPDHSEMTARAGQAEIVLNGRSTPLAAGQTAVLDGDGRIRLRAAPPADGFDRWVAERENATLAAAGERHVSPAMTGYEDLDAYGDWSVLPEYGAVWYPSGVAVGWAPYRDGRWAWIPPWGWTWIDYEPWGFAPFHYGRWLLIGGRWGWVPGRAVVRPVYAPALVGWVGGAGWSVSFSFGTAPAVGWFPLAPYEVYVPAYRHSDGYLRRLNENHVRDVRLIERAAREPAHERFAYRQTTRAVTVVPARTLREGRPVSVREIEREGQVDLKRAPSAAPAHDSRWLAPASGAARPRREDREMRQSLGAGPKAGESRLPERGAASPTPTRRLQEGAPPSAIPGEREERRRVTPPPTPRAPAPAPAALPQRPVREPEMAPQPAAKPKTEHREMASPRPATKPEPVIRPPASEPIRPRPETRQAAPRHEAEPSRQREAPARAREREAPARIHEARPPPVPAAAPARPSAPVPRAVEAPRRSDGPAGPARPESRPSRDKGHGDETHGNGERDAHGAGR